jgi:hypothetical protein
LTAAFTRGKSGAISGRRAAIAARASRTLDPGGSSRLSPSRPTRSRNTAK